MVDEEYEKLLVDYQAAVDAHKQTGIKVTQLYNDLEAARKKQKIECPCGNLIQVNEIELVEESFGGWQSGDDWIYSKRMYFVCPSCHDALNPPDNNQLFINGFAKYVKTVLEWNSNYQRPPERVAELMKPWWDKRAAREKEEKLKQEIEAARALLRRVGELP